MSSSVRHKVVGFRYRVKVFYFYFHLATLTYSPKKLWVVDNLLLDHVGLRQVVTVAVHLTKGTFLSEHSPSPSLSLILVPVPVA